jgi:hypothetical protein
MILRTGELDLLAQTEIYQRITVTQTQHSKTLSISSGP